MCRALTWCAGQAGGQAAGGAWAGGLRCAEAWRRRRRRQWRRSVRRVPPRTPSARLPLCPQLSQVLFVLSADRPLTESEVKFLQYVRQWGKKVVFVVNKVRLV